MWTSTIYAVNKDDQRPTAVILFTDNVKYKRLETIDLNGLDSNSFKSRVESMRKNFETSFSFIDGLTTDFSLTIEVPPELTKEELARQAYELARFSLLKSKQDLDLGLKSQEEYNLELSLTLQLKP